MRFDLTLTLAIRPSKSHVTSSSVPFSATAACVVDLGELAKPEYSVFITIGSVREAV